SAPATARATRFCSARQSLPRAWTACAASSTPARHSRTTWHGGRRPTWPNAASPPRVAPLTARWTRWRRTPNSTKRSVRTSWRRFSSSSAASRPSGRRTSVHGSTGTTPSSTDGRAAIESSVLAAIDAGAEPAIRQLQQLIQSPSPSGAEGTAADGETMVGRVFRAASAHGLKVEAQAVAQNSENVIQVLEGPAGKAFIIEAHTDAVPEGDASRWLDGRPYSGARGWVEYLGSNRVAVEVGGQRFEADIRPRMSKIWERFRTTRRR